MSTTDKQTRKQTTPYQHTRPAANILFLGICHQWTSRCYSICCVWRDVAL